MGRRIARLRIEQGMTQEKLAREMGVSAQAVSKWEHDQNYPDISLLVPLATFLGTTTDELLGASTTPSKTDPAKPAEEEKEEAQAESAPEEASSEEDSQHVEVQAVPKKHKHPISLILSGRDQVEDSEMKTSGKGPKTMHIQCIDDDSDEDREPQYPALPGKGIPQERHLEHLWP
ncbi:MAG: helix-turn-helix domain-containing protein [Atopobiaceae bacterium]|nr:helix-turn-helix domain-containing protein [Atopobiaceae bacterium]